MGDLRGALASKLWVALLALAVCGNAAAGLPSAPQPGGAYGPTLRDETAWSVASRMSRTIRGASANQLAWALYQQNPAVFAPGSLTINTGSKLSVPDRATVLSVSDADARAQLMSVISGQPVSAPLTPTTPYPGSTLTPADFAPDVVLPAVEETVEAAPPAEPAPAPMTVAPVTAPEAEVRAGFAGSTEGQNFLPLARGMPATAAYDYLAPLEPRFSGDLDYDYWLGVSALDTGRSSEAVLVLQRAVETDPNYAGARLELARAYFNNGDNESARKEFEILRAQKQPPKVAEAIETYLAAIDRRAREYRAGLGGYVEGFGGYDNNANAATDANTFLGFTLSDSSVETKSAYYGASLGANGSLPLMPGLRLTAEAGGTYKTYPDAPFVDTALASGGLGLEARLGEFTLNLGAGSRFVWLDDAENSMLLTGDLGLSRALGDLWRGGLNLRYGQLRYEAPLTIQDSDQLYAGLFFSGGFAALPRTQFLVAVTGGEDEADISGSPYGRKIAGARLSVSQMLGSSLSLSLSGALLDSDYPDDFVFPDPSASSGFVTSKRDDQQVSGSLALTWALPWSQGLSLRTQVTAVTNDSTIPLYEYDRMDAGLSVRKEFR